MIKGKFALIYCKGEGQFTVFKYLGDLAYSLIYEKREQIKVHKNVTKEIEFYQYYYNIPDKNIIII